MPNLILLLFVVWGAMRAQAQTPVLLTASEPPPAPVGSIITWDAAVLDSDHQSWWYRFRARRVGEDFRVIRDYAPLSTLDWAAREHEGTYEIEVTAKNRETRETSTATALFQVTPALRNGVPTLNETPHPLVFQYSAPPCPQGSRMRVEFQSANSTVQYTPFKPCMPGLTLNFYLAGLRPETEYLVKHTVTSGSQSVDGPVLALTTESVSLPVARFSPPQGSAGEGILLYSSLSQMHVATDLGGNILWFHAGVPSLTRPETGGVLLGFFQDGFADESQQVLREFDLIGTTLRETNAARINEQLEAMGKRRITSFHHEARRLPGGRILALAATEQILTDVQGDGPVDVIGDMILVLDPELQVEWIWDAFDHLDPARKALIGETCTPGGGGCPAFYLAPRANDWTHGNSLQFTPDGNILFSIRHFDWVIKIDYRNGAGDGHILWRLGKEGDFEIESDDPDPWFSHQHDAQLLDADTVLLFDNGNIRRAGDNTANSRGQLYKIDERNRKAKLLLNADLGVYAGSLGSAQKLPNGNYHFNAAQVGQSRSYAIEVDSSGKIQYTLEVSTPMYRSFRMTDLYSPPN